MYKSQTREYQREWRRKERNLHLGFMKQWRIDNNIPEKIAILRLDTDFYESTN